MATLHCVQRADVFSDQRILTVWRDIDKTPNVERVIGYCLGVLAAINADTMAVLNILVNFR